MKHKQSAEKSLLKKKINHVQNEIWVSERNI